ncbi:MAG: TetR/AcrR family transcriptional regulator [Bacteroidales bacterium]|nr:TetR/AcrR family transcriptional regulator [Bacteroidales bacterium]
MAPRTEEQFEEIRNIKVNLIVKTAMELFAINGYDSTSISNIASAAGISKGLMYNYFSSKDELLKKVMLSGMENFMLFLEVKDVDSIKKEEIVAFIDGNFNLLQENTEYYKLYFSLAFQPKVFALLSTEFMVIFEQLIEKLVLYYTQKGADKPYAKARLLLATFDGIGIHYLSDIEYFPLDDVRKLTIEML